MSSSRKSERVVIVGGGVSGLSIAARLAQSGVPVTLLEASQLGFAASTRNQGWLHSGAVFARDNPQLARMCYASFQQVAQFCPECLEPSTEGMAYLISKPDTLALDWTQAWDAAGIPWERMELDALFSEMPQLDRAMVQHAFLLPDRAMRSDILLQHLAAAAKNAGAEIRTETSVRGLRSTNGRIECVTTGTGEEIPAGLVILAGGATGMPLLSDFVHCPAGKQSDYTIVPLKTHVVAIKPEIGRRPFCVVDAGGFNHIPHAPQSVFASNRWVPVANSVDQTADAGELRRLWDTFGRLFPRVDVKRYEVLEWAGTALQAMHVEQVEPGLVPLPTVIDHAHEGAGAANLLSVFSGRASLWPELAEETRKVVLSKLNRAPTGVTRPPWA